MAFSVSLGKDKLHKLRKTCGYKIGYQERDATYVGQTSCSLRKRVGEHKGDIQNNGKSSCLALHTISANHKMNLENFEILDAVNYKKYREFVEIYVYICIQIP